MNRKKTDFVWNGQNLASETTNDVTTVYNYDPTGIITSAVNGEVTKYVKDPHGNVVVTSRNGSIVGEYDYSAFGEQLTATDTTNPFRYCGEYYDNENGLTYLRNRYYDSNTGRFLSEDMYWNMDNMIYGDEKKENLEGENINNHIEKKDQPQYINILQSTNLYVYALNDPIVYVDRQGKSVTAYGVVVSAGVGFAGYEGMYLWATDDKGNFALLAVNGYSSSVGASLGIIGMTFPDMPSVDRMYGYGFGISGSLNGWGAGVTFGGDKGEYSGYVVQGGVGGSVNVWVGGDGSYVSPIFSGNIYNISGWMKSVINRILPDNLKI